MNKQDQKQKIDLASSLINEQRYDEALSILWELSALDNPHAIGLIGTMYQLGIGLPLDSDKAIDFLERASNMGNGFAAHNLGTVYMGTMPGVPKDTKLAMQYYRKAKALGAVFAPDDWYQ